MSLTATRARRKSSAPPLVMLVPPALAIAFGLSLWLHVPEVPYFGLVVGVIFATFLMLVAGPAYAVLPSIMAELSVATVVLPQVGASVRLLSLAIAVLLTFPLILRRTRFDDPALRRVLLPAILFIAIATPIEFALDDFDFGVKYLRFQTTQLLALVVTAALVRERRHLLMFGLTALAVGSLGGVAALTQHYWPENAIYGLGNPDVIPYWKGRSTGLTASPVDLANQMISVLAPLLGYLAVIPWRWSRRLGLLLAALAAIFIGVYFSYTRSALLALGPALLVMGMMLRGRRQRLLVGTVVAVALGYQLLAGTGLIGARYYRDANNDQSAASHVALWEAGFQIALANSLIGIGHRNFEQASLNYRDADGPDATTRVDGSLSVGNERPHNDFLSVWLSWGFSALVAFMAIYVGAIVNAVRAARSPDLLVRGLAIGVVGGLVAYGTNSAFHNSLDSSTFLWTLAGLSVVLQRLASQQLGRRIT